MARPELGCAVEARRRDERAVGAYRNGDDRAAVPTELRAPPAQMGCPDLAVPSQLAQTTSPGARSNVLDIAGVPTESSQPLEGLGVPYAEGVVAIVVAGNHGIDRRD